MEITTYISISSKRCLTTLSSGVEKQFVKYLSYQVIKCSTQY